MVVTARRTAIRDGVRLRYLDSGMGSPPLLFIHGWSCSAWFWREQIAAFEGKHRTVALDLRGHGESDKPHQDYTIAAFADDVAWLCRQVRLERPVIIGHSMGGVIAVRLVLDRPELAAAVVIVDSPIVPFTEPLASRMEQIVVGLSSSAYKDTAQALLQMMFQPHTDPKLRYQVESIMLTTPQHVMASAFKGLLEAIPALPPCNLPVPALFVAAADAPWSLEAVKARFHNMRTAQVVGAGHFLQLEVPEQFNAMLRRFLDTGTLQ